jgi:DNA-binding NtrC family response regulator
MPDLTIPIGSVSLAEAERMVIEATVEDAGSITQAALVLEVQRVTIQRKRKQWREQDGKRDESQQGKQHVV